MSYKIISLHVYPIKSCAGFSVNEVLVTKTGFEWDRHWVIVDNSGVFLSQRKHRRMALIKTAMKETADGLCLEVQVPGYEIPFLISTSREPKDSKKISVWKDEIIGHIENPDVNEALSDFIGESVSLVRLGSLSQRRVDFQGLQTDLSFVDSLPVLVTNTESLKDLEAKVGDSIPMNRFRANIVLEGSLAFEEDLWSSLKINEVELKSAVPCARCVVITNDQVTGEARGPVPLKTLSTYRKVRNRVNFGQFHLPTKLGKISLKDRAQKS